MNYDESAPKSQKIWTQIAYQILPPIVVGQA